YLWSCTCSSSPIEPFTSANDTVTSWRSPSSAVRDVRIFSARCLGVEMAGGLAGAGGRPAPQPPQNFSRGPFAVPHDAQRTASAAPHSPQKRRSAPLSWSQDGQRIAGHLACAVMASGATSTLIASRRARPRGGRRDPGRPWRDTWLRDRGDLRPAPLGRFGRRGGLPPP